MSQCCAILVAMMGVMPMSDQSEHVPLTAKQQAAIDEIEALGGNVFYVLNTDQQIVESITFRGPRFTDAQLSLLEPFRGYDLYALGLIGTHLSEETARKAIRQFPKLKSLAIMDAPWDDEILPPLAQANELVSVTLRNMKVTSAGIKHLAGLSNLTTLDLTDCAIDDAALKHVEGLSNLQWLALGNTHVTSEGIKSIGKLTNLEALLFNGTHVTDEGLAWLAQLKRLDTLRLDNTRITDAGLVHLKQLTKLKYLTLDNTDITDDGLEHLQDLPKLDDISMRGTKVTRRGGDRFILYLPANKERFRKQREQFERGVWPLD